ncbi:hypothetical protein TWF481_002984 [Arthrobotrys musiformis]|uniref:Uncharacterized protein n=1 Tax=Arthrobotrys musiformis TaxID=47236 RepID=A0AAV9VRY9_9PEZI
MTSITTTSPSRANIRQQVSAIYLSQFGKLTVKWKKGEKMTVPDAISRLRAELDKKYPIDPAEKEMLEDIGYPGDIGDNEVGPGGDNGDNPAFGAVLAEMDEDFKRELKLAYGDRLLDLLLGEES